MSNEPQTQSANFATTAAHAGMVEPGDAARAGEVISTVKPVYMSSTYLASTIEEMDQVFGGERQGFVYGRYANPNTAELERVVALLEGGKPENAAAYGSGMATIHSSILAAGVVAGDKIVASRDLYGQTWALLN